MGRKRGSKNVKAPIAAETKAPADAGTTDVAEKGDAGGTAQSAADAAVAGEAVSQQPGAVASGDDNQTGETRVLTDGQEKGSDVQGAEGAAAQGAGDPDGKADAGVVASGVGQGDTAGNGEADVSAALPRYRCHKVVQALQIAALEINADNSAKIAPKDDGYAPFVTAPGWALRFSGAENNLGYYVVYEDGYASWSPAWAFEAGYTLMRDDDRDDLTFKSPLDIAELARGVAGAARFFADGAVGASGLFDREEAAIMADFVRTNPDAPVEAMFIHLGLQKRYPRTEPNTADRFVLGMFHAAASAAIKFEADRAAEEAAAQAKPAPAGTWPGEQALKPQEPAFSPTGFSPR